MHRRFPRLWACALLGAGLTGCTNLLTQQAIDRFATGIQSKDLDSLKDATSPGFEEKALRLSESTTDLKVLNIPTGKVTIVKVQETAPGERKVYVKVGEKGQQLEYRLVKDPDGHSWVVDDLVLPKSSKSTTAPVSRSVAEQMDLLLSLREFLKAWQEGERDDILRVCSPDLRQQLEGLPEPWLKQLASQVVADVPKHKSLRPDARVDKDHAVLMLGKLVVEFRQIDGHWQLTDAAADSKEQSVRSSRKLAGCLVQTQKFLQAYGSGIKTTLEEATTAEFHNQCLAGADLATVPLPVQPLLGVAYDAKQQKNHTEILLEGPGGTYMFTLLTGDLAPTSSTPIDSANAAPRISEVTIFEKSGSQVKRLSSMFLSQALLHVYADALINRDKIRLEKMSTEDFKRRVWSRADQGVLKTLPFPEVEAAPPEVTATVFQGDVTEVTVSQGSRALTYVLHSTKAGLLVDDVLMPVLDRPSSLKANAEQMIPIYQFAAGMYNGNLKMLRQASDEGLNRIVWMQLRSSPDFQDLFQCDAARRLTGPVESIRNIDSWSVVRIRSPQDGPGTGADVTLVREGDRYLVHDVKFVNGTEATAHRELLRTIRNQIAATMQRQHQEAAIQQASAEMPTSFSPKRKANNGDAPGAVQPALYEDVSAGPQRAAFLEDDVEFRE